MSGNLSFGPINILSIIQPQQIFGPQVNTTLTNKPAGPYFSERQYLEALKYRKPPPAQRQISAKEKAELNLRRAEGDVKSLPTMILGRDDNAKIAHANLKQARKDRDHEYFMEIVKNEWAKFKNAR